MRLIESRVEFLPQEPGIEGAYKVIEKAGRTCYKSEDKITEDSAKGFVDRMIKSGHGAMLEHGTVYLKIPILEETSYRLDSYISNPYTKTRIGRMEGNPFYYYVVSNLRVLQEHNWLDDLQYLCSPTEFHEKRYTFKFTTDRSVSHELVRHRAFSFGQESQRYCGYDKDKFRGELTFIMPSWYQEAKYDSYKLNEFDKQLERVEELYMFFRNCDMQPQEARAILPNCTKTDVVMTGLASDWRYLIDLRLFGKTGKPNPDMVVLMEKLKAEAEKHSIWDDIMKSKSKFE